MLHKSEVWLVADSSPQNTEMVPVRRKKCYKPRRCPPEEEYKSLYRFKDENVKWTAAHVLPETEERRVGSQSSEDRMKIFQRYMADPGFETGIGEEIGVHQSTVSKTVTYVKKK
ncbi:hypothetical protein L9F63_028354 [Diploptera punctata]|uniref:Uncharacterized protein n=1 Tax=Diploptera punctata TaxID=6984 RepID=A0AAD7ZV89_DIPPU|nr:hypothetical protein L9F63_028354 [Diploptera punctata]